MPGKASAEPPPAALAAYHRYIQLSEQRFNKELSAGPFLWIDGFAPQDRQEAYSRLKRGEVLVYKTETQQDGRSIPVPHGLIHHWLGIAFIPGVSIQQVLSLLQDYNHQATNYAPEVSRSRLLQRNGDDFKIYLRLRKKKVVTVVLDTYYDVHYANLDASRAYSSSHTTRVAEIENPDQANEHEKPPGHDTGYMWALDSYWRFWQHDGGVYVQLEAISLTRDIPTGLGWLIGPFVTSIPRESLEFTLKRTRDVLTGAYKTRD